MQQKVIYDISLQSKNEMRIVTNTIIAQPKGANTFENLHISKLLVIMQRFRNSNSPLKHREVQ